LSYQPNPLYDNTDLGRYLREELQKITDHLRTNEIDSLEFKVWTVLPDKPRAGQVYYADGSLWNPGSGEGLYLYLSGATWSKL